MVRVGVLRVRVVRVRVVRDRVVKALEISNIKVVKNEEYRKPQSHVVNNNYSDKFGF